MILLALLLACALSIGLGWVAIVELLGWWAVGAIAYLYLLALAAIVSVGGVNAALIWLARRWWDR